MIDLIVLKPKLAFGCGEDQNVYFEDQEIYDSNFSFSIYIYISNKAS